jgi:predicted metal-dependent peptidase
MPFMPRKERLAGGYLAVVVDTSGSINDKLLSRFTAEIIRISKLTNSRVLLVVCDAKVHDVKILKTDKEIQGLRNFEYKGGGGTNFRPAFKEIERHMPVDAIVFLTDTYGTMPQKDPGVPTLWTVPPGIVPRDVPFGRVLRLQD